MFDGFLNGLKPVAELAMDKPHGSRIKYMSGCRCVRCRAANSNYQAERAAAHRRGEWNGCVPADTAREHLQMLSRHGIGRRSVADITGIAESSLQLISQGKRKNLRAMNEKKILSVGTDAVNDASLVAARETWQRVRWLMSQGFTKAGIAKRLGYKNPALQFNKRRLTARNAVKIERLYNMIRAGE